MNWKQLKIKIHSKFAEELSDLMSEFGALSITFEDVQDDPIFEPLPGETPLWQNTFLIALFNDDFDFSSLIKMLEKQPFFEFGFDYLIETIENRNWEREWMDNFHPIKCGETLWICPSWQKIPDPNANNVILDPGLAFGSGTHETTFLCLNWLDSINLKGKTMIDFGCGSGILAIAALKLGAKHVVAIDLDPQALSATRENAKRNNVENKIVTMLPENLPKNLLADILIANILAGPLKELKPTFLQLLESKGKICLSGILNSQKKSLMNCYSLDFKIDAVTEKNDWCRITATKNK